MSTPQSQRRLIPSERSVVYGQRAHLMSVGQIRSGDDASRHITTEFAPSDVLFHARSDVELRRVRMFASDHGLTPAGVIGGLEEVHLYRAPAGVEEVVAAAQVRDIDASPRLHHDAREHIHVAGGRRHVQVVLGAVRRSGHVKRRRCGAGRLSRDRQGVARMRSGAVSVASEAVARYRSG